MHCRGDRAGDFPALRQPHLTSIKTCKCCSKSRAIPTALDLSLHPRKHQLLEWKTIPNFSRTACHIIRCVVRRLSRHRSPCHRQGLSRAPSTGFGLDPDWIRIGSGICSRVQLYRLQQGLGEPAVLTVRPFECDPSVSTAVMARVRRGPPFKLHHRRYARYCSATCPLLM